MYYVLWSCVTMYVVLHLLQQFYMVSMLSHANGLNGDISKWDVSRVTIMLPYANVLNGDISKCGTYHAWPSCYSFQTNG